MISIDRVRDIIKSGDKIFAAVSGGIDSMSLLFWLNENKDALKISLGVVNIEHGIRKSESVRDSEFVKDWCASHGVLCTSVKVDALSYKEEKGLTLEQAARELRYGVFDELLKKGVCDKIATAHNADDNAETVLMRILRGTGLKGLVGIGRARGAYIRPLLNTTRAEIESYVADNKIPYVVDSTNFDTEYTRNFLRHEIFGKLKDRFDCGEAFRRLSAAAVENERYFDRLLDGVVKADKGAQLVPISYVGEPALFTRLINKAFVGLKVVADIEERHYKLLQGLALRGENGDTFDMPYNTCAALEYDNIALYRKQKKCMDEKAVSVGKTCLGCYVATVSRIDKRIEGKLCFDMDKLPAGAVLRTRRDGDTFTKFGGGTKGLNDYLTDKKYPVRLRDSLPLITCGKDVLIVCGVEIGESVKIDKNTVNAAVLELEYLGENN